MDDSVWEIREGEGRLIAAAIHNGHAVRNDVLEHLALSEPERLREEDPFTEVWTSIGPTQIIGRRSRFEVDLNRPRHQAVYSKPEDAWGLDIWKDGPPPEVIDRSLEEYDAFYREVGRIFSKKAEQGAFVVYDLHSYNHRRAGPDHPPDNADLNPDVNVGTGSMDRRRWAPVVDRFIDVMRTVDFRGRRLDVRENVKFRGGFFPEWTHTTFADTGCALAIEVKKFFMDEWTGEPDRSCIQDIRAALEETVDPVLDALHRTA